MKKYTSNSPFFRNKLNSKTIQCFCFLFVLICLFSCSQKAGKEYYTMEQGFSWPFFWDVHEDNKGQIWLASGWQGGIHRLNPDTGEMTRFIGTKKAGIGGGRRIFEDSKHNLWFGGKGLVAKYDSVSDQIDFSFQIDPVKKGWVNHFIEDDEQNIWFGTESRIMQVVKNGNELANDFPVFDTEKHFPDLTINSLIKDNRQNIWMGSYANGLILLNDGLKNLSDATFPYLQYGKADGLKSNFYVNNSVLLDSKNRLWWGTDIIGVTRLDLNKFKIPTEAPKNLSLSYINIQQQFIDFGGLRDTTYSNTLTFGEVLSESFDSVVAFNNFPTILKLPYDLNHLTFHFAAIDWAAPHKIQYSYQIEGLEKEWSQPNTEAKADYRNLPYGTHTFKVKAIGEARVWSEPFEYTFTILPPWWHTWWAYGLYAVLAFGASGWYIQRLRRQIHQKQEQLDRE